MIWVNFWWINRNDLEIALGSLWDHDNHEIHDDADEIDDDDHTLDDDDDDHEMDDDENVKKRKCWTNDWFLLHYWGAKEPRDRHMSYNHIWKSKINFENITEKV